jgi:hypothetical protein
MFGKRLIGMVLAVVLGLGSAREAAAQAEIEALVYDWPSQSLVAQSAIRELGYTLSVVSDETFFIQFLNQQSWDLVVLQLPRDDITKKAVVAQLLEDHVAAGGRLLVNYNHLDQWSRLQALMGVERAEDPPLRVNVIKSDPIHPSFPRNHYGSGNPVIGSAWPDKGDWLWPSSTGELAGIFMGGEPAIVVSNEGRTIVNGFDWDSYAATESFIREQIKYIMSCKPDLDPSTGSGVLDIFDFLAFQNLFVQQDPLANMAFNANFDIFDFLAFQSTFVQGCQ